MDGKYRRLIRGIVVINIMAVAMSIFLWVIYGSYAGILVVITVMWTSFTVVRIIMSRHRVYEYRCIGNCFVDRLVKKLIRW